METKKKPNMGKRFERNFKESALQDGLFILRLNDTDTSFNHRDGMRFTPTNPADFITFLNGELYLLELKSTEYKSLSIQRDPEDKNSKMIKAHQIADLVKYSLFDGVNCGFVLNFRSKDSMEEETFYLSIENFSRFMAENPKESINRSDVVLYDGVKLDQKLKRTQYHYQVKELLERLNRIKREGGGAEVTERDDFTF